MTLFHDVSFPLPLALGAKGGPERRTDITQLASGHEHRSTPHAASKRRFDVGAGVKSRGDLQTLIAFFEARMGQLYAFRFRDPMDFSSAAPSQEPSLTDQIIGVGDGQTVRFFLVKTYADIAGSYARRITKPVPGSVLVGIDGQPQTPVIDTATGEAVFTVPPPVGAVISAGFEFDTPVRFDTARLDLALEGFGAGRAVSIPLVEVSDYA